MAGIYRKASMERLSSPEQLDKLIKIASPSSWLALIGGGIIIIGVLIWGFYGKLPKTLDITGIFINEISTDKNVISYVPLVEGKKLKEGMITYITPTNVNEQEYGHIEGKIVSVATYTATTKEMLEILGNESLVTVFQQQGPVIEVKISLLRDQQALSEYKWSNKKGINLVITDSTLAMIKVMLESESPISKLFPAFKGEN